ncbi:MAG TPA: hypothetical protein VGO62_16405 [Myxococcota bacterium]|jgi:hypothetical protein
MPTKKKPAKKSGKKKKPAQKASKASAAELKQARVMALTQVFKALGAKSPERWANNHVDNGSDELGRFVLLRALWFRTVEPGRLLASARKDKLVGPIVDRLSKSAGFADLDALLRFAQKTALDEVCRVIDDPADNDDGIRWALFRVDSKGLPLWPLANLRKDLSETEP